MFRTSLSNSKQTGLKTDCKGHSFKLINLFQSVFQKSPPSPNSNFCWKPTYLLWAQSHSPLYCRWVHCCALQILDILFAWSPSPGPKQSRGVPYWLTNVISSPRHRKATHWTYKEMDSEREGTWKLLSSIFHLSALSLDVPSVFWSTCAQICAESLLSVIQGAPPPFHLHTKPHSVPHTQTHTSASLVLLAEKPLPRVPPVVGRRSRPLRLRLLLVQQE